MDREQKVPVTDGDTVDGSFEIKLSITKHKYLHIIKKKKEIDKKTIVAHKENDIDVIREHYKKLVKEINDLEEEYQNALK